MLMKAVQFYGPGNVRIEDIPVPSIEPGGLLAKVEACAICGSDLKAFLKGNPRIKPPQTMGHEFVAAIVELGKNARGFSVGDRITMATSIACGVCWLCRSGRTNLCNVMKPISYDYPGAFAEFIAIPESAVNGNYVVKVAPDIGDIAALAEPISCAINAQLLSQVSRGQIVAVIGCGPLGAIHTQIAKACDAAKVIVTARSQYRLKLAEKLGVDEIIDSSAMDPVAAVVKASGGFGADVVIVTAPDAHAQEQAITMARKGGVINLFASLPAGASELRIDSRLVHYRELSITGASDSTAEHVRMAVDLLKAGKISPHIITHRFPITAFLDAMEILKRSEALKILIKPGSI